METYSSSSLRISSSALSSTSENAVETRGCCAAAPCIGRLRGERRLGPRAHVRDGRARSLDERPRELLVEQREHEVLGIDLGVAAAARQLLRGADRLLRLDGQPVEVHVLFVGRGSVWLGSL